MAKMNVTPDLATFLKTIRNEYNITATFLAEQIDKSPAYINKLEKAEIKTIEYSELKKIMSIVVNDQEKVDKLVDELSENNIIIFSDEDIEQSKSWLNFDKVIREIPISNDLINHINKLMEKHNISIDNIVKEINNNTDLKENETEGLEKNIYHVKSNGDAFVILDVNYDLIENIIKGKKDTSNYTYLEAILYSIYKLSGEKNPEAHILAINDLFEFKFYSIEEKQRLTKGYKSIKELKEILPKIDSDNIVYINHIIRYFKFFSDIDVKYSTEKLQQLDNNFKEDAALTMAFLGIDISRLKSMDINQKRNFIKDVENLITEYNSKIPKREDITLI